MWHCLHKRDRAPKRVEGNGLDKLRKCIKGFLTSFLLRNSKIFFRFVLQLWKLMLLIYRLSLLNLSKNDTFIEEIMSLAPGIQGQKCYYTVIRGF